MTTVIKTLCFFLLIISRAVCGGSGSDILDGILISQKDSQTSSEVFWVLTALELYRLLLPGAAAAAFTDELHQQGTGAHVTLVGTFGGRVESGLGSYFVIDVPDVPDVPGAPTPNSPPLEPELQPEPFDYPTPASSAIPPTFQPTPPPPSQTPRSDTDRNSVRMLVYVADMTTCKGAAGAPAVTTQQVETMLWGSSGQNLRDYISSCSFGAASILTTRSRVLTVPMPCAGPNSLFGTTWTLDTCQNGNVYGWMEAANNYAQAAFGLDSTAFNHRIMILPKLAYKWMDDACGWAGLGATGPIPIPGTSANTYSTWLAGDYALDLKTIVHELGHNWGLPHAEAAGGCGECDMSSVMGAWGSSLMRCFNAPEAWAMGWAQEASPRPIDLPSLQPGATRTFTLAYQGTTTGGANATLVIRPGPSAPVTSLFVSVRANANASGVLSYDTPWEPRGNGSVLALVHSWDVSQAGSARGMTNRTLLQASLSSPSQQWTSPTYDTNATSTVKLVVRLVAVSPQTRTATVSLCRPSITPESWAAGTCNDGLDNDCDGLVDAADPGCGAASGAGAGGSSSGGGGGGARPPPPRSNRGRLLM